MQSTRLAVFVKKTQTESLVFNSEIAQNQKMWAEEHGESKKESAKGSDLRNVGLTGGGISADTDAQTGDVEPDEPLDVTDSPDAGQEGAPEGTAEV